MNMIETRGLTRKFGDFVANDRIDLCVEAGEIKAIVGENGAGKTTLMNMLYGLLQPTEGQILIRGEEVHFHSPLAAIRHGLGMVHQHFKLVPSLTVYENILLGTELTLASQPMAWLGQLLQVEKLHEKHWLKKLTNIKVPIPVIDNQEELKRISDLISKYKLELDPQARVADISIGARQRVEILKMLYRNVDILILDEPTAVLTPQEVTELIANLKELKANGKTLILITHKLYEVMAVSDSVTVIKRGQIVGNVRTSETNETQLAQMMVGRDVVLTVENNHLPAELEIAYSVEGLSTTNEAGKEVLHDISFQIRKGEILGIAGVEGNGQSELVKVLTGLMTTTRGTVKLGQKDISNAWPADLRQSGIAIIPEDRYAQGLCRDMTIADNCISGYHAEARFCKMGILNRPAIRQQRDSLVEQYDIRISDLEGNVSQLSGGNAQKIIIGREMDSDPEVLIASQPTRGVDVGSIEFIHQKLLDFKAQKRSILLVSSELNEIMSLSDRVLVMYKGSIIGELSASEMDKEMLGLLMAGIPFKKSEAKAV